MFAFVSLWTCGRNDGGSSFNPPTQPAPQGAPSPLELRLEVPAEARSGAMVPVRLVLVNHGIEPVEVGLSGNPIAFDLVVTDANGAEVWRRLEGVAVEDILVTRTVLPGREIEFQDYWAQRDQSGRRVPPGTYRLRGILPVVEVTGGWGTGVHTLTITP
jgi:hypothetical protein